MNKPKIEDHIKTEYIEVTLTHRLKKDMKLNEEICGDCKGLGVGIHHANYGITVDGQKLGDGYFPFDKESIIWCRSCYNGIRKRCTYCNELVDRRWVECQCDKSKEARGVAQWQKDAAQWEEAIKITYKEALEKFEMLYIDSLNKYCMVDELAENLQFFIEDNAETSTEDILNFRIYGTYETQAIFDASDILSSATEGLHDEAYDRSKHVIGKLQEELNKIADEISNDTKTYFSDEKWGVKLTNEDLKRFELQF